MSTAASPHPFTSLVPRTPGTKLFLIVALALAMSISGLFVDNMTAERADRRGLLAASAENPSAQPKTVLGVRLADSYRSTRRSLHYIPLFLGLVFLTYFLFEMLSGRSVHPAQYTLVGIAQIVFYLLLLSLAEHLGFDLSFLLAGAATTGLLAVNTEWVFRSRGLALRALAVFSALYAFIYILLRVETYALLVGAIASFAAIATAMYATRNINWYATGAAAAAFQAAAGMPPPSARESWLE